MFANNRKFSRSGDQRGRRARSGFRLNPEALEARQLMAYSAFGNSLPQLSVTGYAAPAASPGGSLAVDVLVENQGASSLIEPTALAPGSLSSADVLTTTVQIYASATANARGGYVLLGSLTTPEIRQNSEYETVTDVTVPTSLKGFTGNKFYLTLAVNNSGTVIESNTTGSVYHIPKAVTIQRDALPDLQVVGFDIPQPLVPGAVIAPTIRIENFGVGTATSIPVDLVASLDKQFGAGDAIAASFTIPSLPGTSGVPTQTNLNGLQNVVPQANVYTITLPAFQLPTTPGFYYLGIKIDPTNSIAETYKPTTALSALTPVGPANTLLPVVSTVSTGAVSTTFPELPITAVNPSTTVTTPIITASAVSTDGVVAAAALNLASSVAVATPVQVASPVSVTATQGSGAIAARSLAAVKKRLGLAAVGTSSATLLR